MGQFRWTAFDYLGETNQWPSRMANFGVIDICGFPKDHYYLYQSLWTDKPMVHMLPHWTHPGKEGVIIPMVVYTNCDEVNLQLNGKDLGTKPYLGEQLVWDIPYQPGELVVTGFKNGKLVAKEIVKTAGKPAKIQISTAEKSMTADGKDVLLCEVTITDEQGIPVPQASPLLSFEISGKGTIKGTDNGDPLDLTDYTSTKRRAFKSKCLVVIQAIEEPGNVVLEASGEGLATSSLKIEVK
jgi:beta-galactosidase